MQACLHKKLICCSKQMRLQLLPHLGHWKSKMVFAPMQSRGSQHVLCSETHAAHQLLDSILLQEEITFPKFYKDCMLLLCDHYAIENT